MTPPRSRASRETPSSRSTDPFDQPSGFVPMHSRDVIVALRITGTPHALELPVARSFTIGTGREADVRLPFDGSRRVSRLHARVTRRSDRDDIWLEVNDLDSTNGTFVAGERIRKAVVRAGQRFSLAETELLVMDKILVRTRAMLAGYLGYSQDLILDSLVAIVEREPLVVCGVRGSERERFAVDVHQASRRVALPFVTVDDPRAAREAMAVRIGAAAGGTVFTSLDRCQPGASIEAWIGLAFDRALRAVPIVAAKTPAEASKILGNASALFRRIELPALSTRTGDVPRLLDEMWLGMAKRYRHTDLAPGRLAAMCAYGWPSDRTELRDIATRLAAVFEHDGNLTAAAAAVGQSYQWFRESLLRCGAIVASPRGRDD